VHLSSFHVYFNIDHHAFHKEYFQNGTIDNLLKLFPYTYYDINDIYHYVLNWYDVHSYIFLIYKDIIYVLAKLLFELSYYHNCWKQNFMNSHNPENIYRKS
jgi:hypothetical protein